MVEVAPGKPNEAFEVGKIHVWEPAARLVFDFRVLAFEPGENTVVDVRFESDPGGTRVTVEHRGWDEIRADHPARHALGGGAFDAMMEMGNSA